MICRTRTRSLLTLSLGAALAGPAGAQSGSETVLGTANLFAAGGNAPAAPGGGGAGTAPTLIALSPGTGRTLRFTTVTGMWGCAGVVAVGPDGGNCAGSSTDVGSSGAIAGIQTQSRTMFLAGVFLGPALPAAAPARLVYTTADLSNLTFPVPQLGQIFFIGDGLTGTGAGSIQSILVPDAATRLFLGVADAFAFNGAPGYYDDNVGSVTARYEVAGAAAVVPEPTSLALAGAGLLALAGVRARRRR